jgi:hypothetical protein
MAPAPVLRTVTGRKKGVAVGAATPFSISIREFESSDVLRKFAKLAPVGSARPSVPNPTRCPPHKLWLFRSDLLDDVPGVRRKLTGRDAGNSA